MDTSCNTPPVAPGCQAVEQFEQCWFLLPCCCSVDLFKLELKGWRSPDHLTLLLQPQFLTTAGKFRQQSNFGTLQSHAVPLLPGIAVKRDSAVTAWPLVLVAGSPLRQEVRADTEQSRQQMRSGLLGSRLKQGQTSPA